MILRSVLPLSWYKRNTCWLFKYHLHRIGILHREMYRTKYVPLSHYGVGWRMCASGNFVIGSGNCLLVIRHQAITWTDDTLHKQLDDWMDWWVTSTLITSNSVAWSPLREPLLCYCQYPTNGRYGVDFNQTPALAICLRELWWSPVNVCVMHKLATFV